MEVLVNQLAKIDKTAEVLDMNISRAKEQHSGAIDRLKKVEGKYVILNKKEMGGMVASQLVGSRFYIPVEKDHKGSTTCSMNCLSKKSSTSLQLEAPQVRAEALTTSIKHEMFLPGRYNSRFEVKQISTVMEYQERFERIKTVIMTNHKWVNEKFLVACFLEGLKDEIKELVSIYRPKPPFEATSIARTRVFCGKFKKANQESIGRNSPRVTESLNTTKDTKEFGKGK